MELRRAKEPHKPHPKMIGPYAIEAFLGKGGMSLLYLSGHPKNREIPVTVKVLSPRYLSNREVVRRFLREAEIISLADHPNIVKLYGQGEWEGGLYIAMEFIEGITLRQYLLQRPLSLKQALEFIVDIAFALCHLHCHGVIHRDLKPENILVDESKCIKVIDFGTAQLLFDDGSRAGKRGASIVGTPIYMSPEQIESPERVSYPSDIYSLGIVGYELITGKLCHGKVHLSMLPIGLQKIFSRALQPDPSERYRDVVDFIGDISSYVNSPAFQKERQPIDQLSELSDGLAEAEKLLLPTAPPPNISLEAAFIRHKGYLLAGIYFDFFPLGEGDFSLVSLEPAESGVKPLLSTAVLRGMVQAIAAKNCRPSEFLPSLNELLLGDRLGERFLYTYLYTSCSGKYFHYSTSGESSLLLLGGEGLCPLPKNGAPLGSLSGQEFPMERLPLHPGETLLIASSAARGEESGAIYEAIQSAALENASSPPKKLLDAMRNRIRISGDAALQKNSIALIALRSIGLNE